MSRQRLGIRRKRNGWQAFVRVAPGPGGLHTKQFPIDTAIATMRTWREDEVDKFGGTKGKVVSGSFEADVLDYLKRVSAMETIKQRTAHLTLWVAALGGDRPRATITPADIDHVLQGWLRAGLGPATVRKRRTALQSLFVKLDGKHEKNPVRATANPTPPEAEARGIDYVTIARILDQMPEKRDVKKGTLPEPSLTKLRCAVIAYTGLPPAILKRVQTHDLNLSAGTVRARPRRKGKGVEARTVPLTPDGVRAFAAFAAAGAWGNFATQSCNRSFQRACVKASVDPKAVHLYDLRHSFGGELYEVTKDLATVGRFLLHSEGSPITARYAKGANRAVDVAAAAQLGAALKLHQQNAVSKRAKTQKLPGEVARLRKRA